MESAGAPAVGIGPRLEAMLEHLTEGRSGRPPPVQRPLLRASSSAHRAPDMVAYEVVKKAIEGAPGIKRLEAQLDDRPCLRLGLQVDVARGEEHRSHWDARAQGAALGVVQAPPLQPLPPRLAFDLAHRALQTSSEAIIGIAGIVHPVLIGEEGAKQGAHRSHMRPVCRAARQPTHLQAEYDADMVQCHLREKPLEAMPILGRSAALPLILVNDQDAGCGPAQRDGIVA
jgi:hypothetical protein